MLIISRHAANRSMCRHSPPLKFYNMPKMPCSIAGSFAVAKPHRLNIALQLLLVVMVACATADSRSREPDNDRPFRVQLIGLPTYKPPHLTSSSTTTVRVRSVQPTVAVGDRHNAIDLVEQPTPKTATTTNQRRAADVPSPATPSTPSAAKRAISSSNSAVVQSIPSASKSQSTTNTANAIPQDEHDKPPPADAFVKAIRGTAPGDAFECPKDEYFQLFPQRCSKHGDCKPGRNGDEFRCCRQAGGRRCVKAVARPLPEPKHEPILGVIPRRCPREPLAELFWDLQTCDTDRDCWPRVCCPDGARKYCRTAQPELDKSSLSVARQLQTPLESVSRYIQCTPPPPAVFDLHPKRCNSTLDCFPNVCCQEAGRRHCRPPRRSLLSLLTGFASRFNTGIIRQWTQSIVIR